MIVEWLVSVGAGFVGWIGSLFPPMELPEWVTSGADDLYAFMESASGLGVWFPWTVISVVIGSLLTFYLLMFGVSIFFKAAKHIPFVGGGG